MTVTPEKSMKFLKLCVVLSFSWPLPKNASKLRVWSTEILWWLSFSNAIVLFVCVICCAYANRKDIIVMTRMICGIGGIINVFSKMAVCRCHRQRILVLMEEVEEFLKCAKMYERRILTEIVNRYTLFNATLATCYYSIVTAVCFGPLILPQPFPLYAEYPFDVDKLPLNAIVYAHHCLSLFQAAAISMTDCQFAMILWFAAARFKMLAVEIESVVDESELYDCIKKHYFLLRYVDEAKILVRSSAFTTIIICTAAVACAGLQLFSDEPLVVRLPYGSIAFCGPLLLFVYIWPADTLAEMSASVGMATYFSPWIGKSSKMMRSMLLIFVRTQKPVTVGAGSIVPELSFKFYSKVLSTIFSYFTTLRLLLDESSS